MDRILCGVMLMCSCDIPLPVVHPGLAATAPGKSFSTTPGGRKLSALRGANDDDDDDD